MLRRSGRALAGFLVIAAAANAQTPLSWEQIRERFRANNPTLKAARLSIDEAQAAEVTAYLRPNPDVGLLTDGTQLVPQQGVWRPFQGTVLETTFSYLHERQHKRELRRDAARQSTVVAQSQYTDQERNLTFNLRSAFVQTLQAKAVLQNARENLEYWDHELDVNRTRFEAGGLSRADLNRMKLQRVQFESDFETAMVNLRTAKIQLLMLLNDRIPIEQFDVAGPFDFTEELKPLEEFRKAALETRPDLKAAVQNIELAKLNHQLAISNGSTDPTWGAWYSKNPSFNNPLDQHTIGVSVTIPLRIFDRNQGEKARTQLDIGRNERLRDANEAQIFNDVDSAYWTLVQNVTLLKPYKTEYLPLATDVRDTVTYSYQNGAASLLDLLDAEKSYRDTRLAYVNLVGAYLTAAAQMNMAAGQEIVR
jgi:cobalt-zinc-cadmium efflux system outer membrane protein